MGSVSGGRISGHSQTIPTKRGPCLCNNSKAISVRVFASTSRETRVINAKNRKEAAGRESAYAGSVKKTTLADRESPGTEDEIIVQQSSMITDPDALPSIETLQKTQASTLPLLDPPVSATPGGSMDKDHQGSLIAQVSLGKRKRLTKSTDAMSCRSDNSGSDPQLTDSDSGPDVSITTAAARSLLRGRDCLNSTHVNGLLELFGGCDVQTYHIDEFRSSEEVVRMNRTNLEGTKPRQSCAGQSSEYDGDIRTILNLTYEILGIPMPNYVDIAWWRSVLSSIWEGNFLLTLCFNNESSDRSFRPNDGDQQTVK